MFATYIVTAILGGVLVVLGALGGDHGEAHGEHEHGHEADAWVPVLSLRFWTYLSAFFGVTGLLLGWLSPLGTVATALCAGGVGLVAGTSISYVSHRLRRELVTSGAGEKDLVGSTARVLVQIGPGEAGKVRCQVKGEILDLLATSDGERALEPGTEVVVLQLDGDRVKVVPMEDQPKLPGRS